ncbi:unnamed protein product, partial [Sphacelaria rigidula]
VSICHSLHQHAHLRKSSRLTSVSVPWVVAIQTWQAFRKHALLQLHFVCLFIACHPIPGIEPFLCSRRRNLRIPVLLWLIVAHVCWQSAAVQREMTIPPLLL